MSNPREGEIEVANLQFLRTASIATLEAYELSRRNAAANLAQQLRVLVHAIADELANADLARFAREARGIPDTSKKSDPFLIDS